LGYNIVHPKGRSPDARSGIRRVPEAAGFFPIHFPVIESIHDGLRFRDGARTLSRHPATPATTRMADSWS